MNKPIDYAHAPHHGVPCFVVAYQLDSDELISLALRIVAGIVHATA